MNSGKPPSPKNCDIFEKPTKDYKTDQNQWVVNPRVIQFNKKCKL